MKKMQCEVCGSTEIKKIDNEIFECQSCGIQYSKNELQRLLVEITGNVKIDRTDEVNNLLRRAAAFAEDGEMKKAQQYYEKVLDIDSENTEATERLSELKKIEERDEAALKKEAQREKSKIKILQHNIEPQDGVELFLRSLKDTKGIVADIYKEVEIISVAQGYYPFCFMNKKYDGTYEGMACYKKQVPYTDYETKTDYSNKNQDGTYKKKQVAVTKYRTEIDRKPVNGTFMIEHTSAYSVCGELNGTITGIAPDKYDETLNTDLYQNTTVNEQIYQQFSNDATLSMFEEYISGKQTFFETHAVEMAIDDSRQIDELKVFVGQENAEWDTRAKQAFADAVRSKADHKVKSVMPGDYSENIHYRWSERYSNDQVIYLPVQIIEYAYRGRFFVSIMSLVSEVAEIQKSFPYNTETDRADNTIGNSKKSLQFPEYIKVGYIMIIVCIVIGPIIGLIDDDLKIGFILGLIMAGICAIITVILHLKWRYNTLPKLKKEYEKEANLGQSIKEKTTSELRNGYDSFFKEYAVTRSLEKARLSATQASVNSYQADISLIIAKCASSTSEQINGTSRTEMIGTQDTNGRALVEGVLYSVYLLKPGDDKIAAARVIREKTGLGLASAKEKVDMPHALIQSNMDANNAEALASALRFVGAIVEIEKDN